MRVCTRDRQLCTRDQQLVGAPRGFGSLIQFWLLVWLVRVAATATGLANAPVILQRRQEGVALVLGHQLRPNEHTAQEHWWVRFQTDCLGAQQQAQAATARCAVDHTIVDVRNHLLQCAVFVHKANLCGWQEYARMCLSARKTDCGWRGSAQSETPKCHGPAHT
jgi:hypothetical protein